MEEALRDVLVTPVSTASPTHPGAREGDTDSTIDLALESPRLAPWTRAETLPPYGSDHLPIVFSLQKKGIEPRRITPISVQVWVWCQSCELTN